MSKVYKLELSVDGCNDFKKRLEGFKNELKKLNADFVFNSVQWIYQRSLIILRNNDTFEPSGLSGVDIDVSYTRTDYSDGSVKFDFYYENSLCNFIEFGTGLVGASDPHPKADELNYGYATGKISSTGLPWNWYNITYGVYPQNKISTYGYEGKQFIYRACQQYLEERQPEKIYNELFIKLKNKYF